MEAMEAKDTVRELMPDEELYLSKSEQESILADRLIQAGISFKAGMKEGITLFAWWKDGEQYVGTCGTTLKQALSEIDVKLNAKSRV